MSDSAGKRSELLVALLQGAALVTVLLYAVLSFSPLVDLVYGQLTTVSTIKSWLFASTGILGLGSVYLGLLLVLSDAGRRAFRAWVGRNSAIFAAFAAAWIVLYSLLI